MDTSDDHLTMSLPSSSLGDIRLLLEVIYNGSIEATLEDLQKIIFLARELMVQIPVSEDMLASLNFQDLPKMKEFKAPTSPPPTENRQKSGLRKRSFDQSPSSRSGDSSLAPPPLKRLNGNKFVGRWILRL